MSYNILRKRAAARHMHLRRDRKTGLHTLSCNNTGVIMADKPIEAIETYLAAIQTLPRKAPAPSGAGQKPPAPNFDSRKYTKERVDSPLTMAAKA